MPDSGTPHDHDVDAEDTPASADESSTDEAAPFQNRAARRAKPTGAKQQQQAQGKAKQLGGRGSVQGPRQWGTRRSG